MGNLKRLAGKASTDLQPHGLLEAPILCMMHADAAAVLHGSRSPGSRKLAAQTLQDGVAALVLDTLVCPHSSQDSAKRKLKTQVEGEAAHSSMADLQKTELKRWPDFAFLLGGDEPGGRFAKPHS